MEFFSWTPREKKFAIALGITLIFLLGVLLWDQWNQSHPLPLTPYNEEMKQPQTQSPPQEAKKHEIYIDVKGAVKKPGIYRLPGDSRVFQVIQLAGGVTPDADPNQVNFAQKLEDGMVIYIPRKGETPSQGSGGVGQKTGKININTATQEELEQLDGLGPAKARAIIQYREKNGPFRSIEEISKVPGIGEKTLERFRDQITV